MDKSILHLPKLMRRLDKITKELEELFPGRHFTLDGHLVGSIGEVWAASIYGVRLDPASARTHDGATPDGRRVQIKATRRDAVALSSLPDHLIVLRLNPDGSADEFYNGPGRGPWDACGKPGKSGQRRIRLTTLRRLMDSVPLAARVPKGNGHR
jgi:hypothetical protein